MQRFRDEASTHMQTAVFEKVLTKFMEEQYIIITGKLGAGKTHLAMSIVDHMITKNSHLIPVIVHSAADFIKLIDNTEQYIVIVDDFGGDIYVNDSDISEWKHISNLVSLYLQEKQIYVIFTASKDVTKQLEEDSDECWIKNAFRSEYLIDLDDSENALTEKEKIDLCLKYAKSKDIQLARNSLSFLKRANTSFGFPVLCKSMTTHHVADVFENPKSVLERQINQVSSGAKSNFIAILSTFLFDGNLPKYKLTDYQDECYNKVLSFVKIRKNYDKILSTAEGLVGTILKENQRLNTFQYVHPLLFQEIMIWFWNRYRDHFIELCPIKCFNCVKIRHTDDESEEFEDEYIVLDQRQYEAVLERFKCELDTRSADTFKCIAGLKLWDHECFVEASIAGLGLKAFFSRDTSNLVLFTYLSELGKHKVIRKLIDKIKVGNDLNAFKTDFEKCIELVCRKGMCNMLELLSEMVDKLPHSVFIALAEAGNIEMIEFLTSQGMQFCDISSSDIFTVLKTACDNYQVNLVKHLFKQIDSVPLLRDTDGRSILHHAVISGSVDILELFLSSTEGFDSDLLIRTKTGITILHTACEYGRLTIVKYLCHLYPSMMLSVDKDGLLPVHYAVIQGHTDCFIYIYNIQKSKDAIYMKSFPSDGRTILHLACLLGRLGMVQHLCETFPDMVKMENDDSLLPVHDAIKQEHVHIVEYLISEVQSSKVLTSDGRTLLHVAAYEGKLNAVKYIAAKFPAMLRICDLDGNTAAHDAAAGGEVEVLQYLLEIGISPKSRNGDGCSMLHDAAYFGRISMVRYLCSNFPDIIAVCSNTGYTSAHAAALGGSVDVLKYLISLNIDPRVVSHDKSTLLHEAAYSGKLEVVQYLCENFPELTNERTLNSFTACHYAVQEGHEEVTVFLLGEICDAEILTNENETLLHIAAYNGRLAVVKYLCREFYNLIRCVDSSGATVLHAAARSGHTETIHFLLDQTIDLQNTVTENGSTLLHLAAYDGKLDMVKFLCDRFPNMLLEVDHTEHSAAHYAAGSGNVEVFKHLVDKGIHALGRTQNGSTCLLKAAYTGNMEMVEYLCEHFTDLMDICDQYGCTGAHYAVCEGHLDILKYLFSKGVSPFSRTVDGHTTLHIAAFHGRLDIVIFLCQEYPDLVPLEDDAAQSVWTFAESSGHKHVLKYLRKLKGHKFKKMGQNTASESNVLESISNCLRSCYSNICRRVQSIICCCRNE